VPLDAVEVAAFVDEVVVEEDFTLVANVVELAFVTEDAADVGDEPPAPQTNGVGPGISYVVRV
jgi:hypothetical protein